MFVYRVSDVIYRVAFFFFVIQLKVLQALDEERTEMIINKFFEKVSNQ